MFLTSEAGSTVLCEHYCTPCFDIKIMQIFLWFRSNNKLLALLSAGSDFVASSYNLEIQPTTKRITLRNISILEDDINEAEEAFIVVVKLVDVAESTACFQRQRGGECMGNTGGIIIRIRDNDRKLIQHEFYNK